MDTTTKAFLFDLLSTPSPTGFETEGQRVWANYIRPFADSVQNDAYGNTWATIEGTEKGKSLMFESHADEIGYMVKYISKEGFLSVSSIGGSDVATARGRWVTFFGDKGDVHGIIGNTAIHIRDRKDGDKAPEVHDLFVDIGAKNAKEVEKMGIRVGHPGVYSDGVRDLGKNCIAGRAIDNRIGGFILTQVLKNLSKSKTKPKWTIHFVNAVQEEIGGHGAMMITSRLKPSAAIVFDVCHSTDTPGIKQAQHSKIIMNEGPTVTHGSCNHPAVVQRLIETAKKEKIGIQHEATSRYSGTDTDQIFRMLEGVPSGLVSIPLRYMHSVVEMIDLRDVEKAVKLLTGFAKSLTPKDEFAVKI